MGGSGGRRMLYSLIHASQFRNIPPSRLASKYCTSSTFPHIVSGIEQSVLTTLRLKFFPLLAVSGGEGCKIRPCCKSQLLPS